jgi:hypothetical protein
MSGEYPAHPPAKRSEPSKGWDRCKRGIRVAKRRNAKGGGEGMLWLIVGIVLLVIAIAGGAIVHPVLFVLGILALVMFVSGWRGRTAL